METLRILLIEDSADDAELIALELADAGIAHQMQRVELRSELEQALERDDWSLVICDSRLPGYSGTEALRWVRARLPDVPFVFCVGSTHFADPAFAEALGDCQGCVDKDALSELPATIIQVMANFAA